MTYSHTRNTAENPYPSLDSRVTGQEYRNGERPAGGSQIPPDRIRAGVAWIRRPRRIGELGYVGNSRVCGGRPGLVPAAYSPDGRLHDGAAANQKQCQPRVAVPWLSLSWV